MAIEKEVKVVISAVDRYSAIMTGFAENWQTIALGIIGAEVAIAGFSIKLASMTYEMGKTFVTSAADFHDAIFNVKAVAGEFGASAEQIDKVLTDLTMRFPITGKAGGEALQLIAQFGYSSEEQLRRVSDAAMTLHIATGENLQNTLEGTMATLNSFGLGIEEIDRVINVFTAASFKSAATVGDLVEAMKFAGVNAKRFGLDLEETVTYISIFRDLGLDASQAGTTLRMALAQLFTETEKGETALKELGLTYKQLQDNVGDTTKFIDLFEGKTITAKQAIDIFGVRAQIMAEVIQRGSENFNNYKNSITGTTAAANAMQEKMKTWDVVTRQVEGSMDVLKKTIGTDLLKALIEVIGIDENSGIRSLITKITELEASQHMIGGPLVDAFTSLKEAASDAFTDMFGDAEGFYSWLGNIATLMGENIKIVGEWAIMWAGLFAEGTKDREDVKTWLQVINGSFGSLSFIVAAFHDMFVGMIYAVELGLAAWSSKWDVLYLSILKGIENIYKLIDYLPKIDMADNLKEISEKIAEVGGRIDQSFNIEAPKFWTDNVLKMMYETSDSISQLGVAQKKHTDEVKLSAEEVKKMSDFYMNVRDKLSGVEEATQRVSDATVKQLTHQDDYWGRLQTGTEEIKKKLEGTEISVVRLSDGTLKFSNSMEKAGKAAEKTKEELSQIEKHELSLEKTKFEHDLKLIEIKTKENYEVVKKNIEWSAKLKIAEMEEGTKRLKVLAETTSESFQKVTETVGDMTALLAGVDTSAGFSKYRDILDIIEQQTDIQREFKDAQIELIKSQTEGTRLRNRLLEEQGLQIKVNIEGDTQGWLEGMLNSLLNAIFIKAQGESFSCFGV